MSKQEADGKACRSLEMEPSTPRKWSSGRTVKNPRRMSEGVFRPLRKKSVSEIALKKRILDGEGVDGLPVLEIFGEKYLGAADNGGCHNQAVVIPEAVAGMDGDGFCQ